MVQNYPAPWYLDGSGYIVIYRFPRQFSEKGFFQPLFETNDAHTSYGALMLVNYDRSTAGPYKELLFTPGKFKVGNSKYHSITKIYVSSRESVENGRRNWGIPKELADFSIKKLRERKEKIVVHNGKERILEIVFQNGMIPFPMSTKLLPLPLVHSLEDTIFFTQFQGNGICSLSKILSMKTNPLFFPDIADVKPLICVGVKRFSLEFPKARIIKARQAQTLH